jgi:serine-protein kinase ATM
VSGHRFSAIISLIYYHRYRSEANISQRVLKEFTPMVDRKHPLNLSKEERLQRFDKILKSYPPIMRHYFTEKQKSPMAWFAMRLNYTRSVATTSIVGYILGLGDRHTANILLDSSY